MDERGYTLYELVMTLGLAALILGLGLPSLGRLVADNRLRAESDALFHAVHGARQASVTRRHVVTLCPSRDGLACADGDAWSIGWIVFENRGASGHGRRDEGEPVLARHTVAADVRIEANRSHFAFRSTVRRATNGTLRVCDRSRRAADRAVVISYTGRPRVAREDTRGRPYRCAD